MSALLNGFYIGENKLKVYRLNIANRVDAAVDMGDIRVFKTANDLYDGVAFPYVRKELIAQALSSGRPAISTNSMVAGVNFLGL